MHSLSGLYGLLLVCVCIIMILLLMVLLLLRRLHSQVKEGVQTIATLIEQQEKSAPVIEAGSRNSTTKICPKCEKEAKADDLKCVYCHTKL